MDQLGVPLADPGLHGKIDEMHQGECLCRGKIHGN